MSKPAADTLLICFDTEKNFDYAAVNFGNTIQM